MRFSAPRSLSPSSTRGKSRGRSTFGVPSDSDDSDLDDSEYSDEFDLDSSSGSDSDSLLSSSVLSASSDSFCYASDSEVPILPQLRHDTRGPSELRTIEETIAAIRLRTRHHDPYEEWEKQTRKDAFRTARKELTATQSQFHEAQDRARIQEMQRQAALHSQQAAEVRQHLDALQMKQQKEESKMREWWRARDQNLWERIELVIKLEEDKVKAKLEEERKLREEEEEKRKKEELMRRLAEEKKKQEEEEKKKKEDNERRAREEQKKREDEEEKWAAEEEKAKAEKLMAEEEGRKQIGLTTADEDWRTARGNLYRLKTEVMKVVKSDPSAKAEWGKWRRQITPKIGQLTNDPQEINRISTQLIDIIKPRNGVSHSQVIYTALLSSLAKAVILQAETEVTAEKRSAGPLAQVVFTLLANIDNFPEIFFARLVQRVGGWPIPIIVPRTDHNGEKWQTQKAHWKAMGYRKSMVNDDVEGSAEYTTRVAGVMRVYFHILQIRPAQKPLKPMFQAHRLWVWVARLMSERALLESVVAAQLLYTALDVLGSYAKLVYGHQWNKMLSLIYEGVTVGLGNDKFIGGDSAEGTAARVRVQLEVERVMAAS